MSEPRRTPSELKAAQEQLEQYRSQIDLSLHQLQEKIDASRETLKNFVQEVRSFEQSQEKDPLMRFGLFLMTGFLLGSMLNRAQQHRETHRKLQALRSAHHPSGAAEAETPHESWIHGTEGARFPETRRSETGER